MNPGYIILFGLLIIGILIGLSTMEVIFTNSGTVQEGALPAEEKECEVKEDCPDRTCFAKNCIANSCYYFQTIPCCGDGICETEETYIIVETYLTCPQDCPKTPKVVLEENIPEIKDYPELEEVFIDLYVPYKYAPMVGFDYSECRKGFFSEEEIEFMKLFLEIYKEKQNLQDYPKEVLYFFASWNSGTDTYYDFNFFSTTLREKALSLEGEDDLTTAGNIYDFVKEYITGRERITKYSWPKSLYDDVELIWQHKTGMCAEHTYLITALLRAAGIPARIIESRLVGIKPHDWIEIYHDGQWIPIPSTGVLDSDDDRIIDLQEYPALDTVIAFDLSKTKFLDCVALAMVPRTFIDYKYTDEFSEALLALAEENEFKDTALDYVSRWKASKEWGEREEFGRMAFENSVAAILGEEKAVYAWLDVDLPFGVTSVNEQNKANLFPENEIAIVGLEGHNKMKSTASFFRQLLELNENKKIDFIVIKDDFSEAVLFDSKDIIQLSKTYDDFKQDSDLSSVLAQFVETFKSIEEGELPETDFSLPAVDYNTLIMAVGTITEEGYKYKPLIGGFEEINGVVFEFETAQAQEDFKYIKFVNEKGETIFEPKSDGYYEICPSYLRISFDQTLDIRKEGDYIIIQGEMHLEE
ncbi:MAG: transglutaminase domain-containing protein [Nanoarchaeota archaeon]